MTREQRLEAALSEVCVAATRQLAGIGRGKEPSPRLQDAIDAASALLERDAAADPNDRHAAVKAKVAELERKVQKATK